MTMNVGRQIATLKRMTVTQLRRKHIEAFGEQTRSGHKEYLVKQIAWRIQAQGDGDLSGKLAVKSRAVFYNIINTTRSMLCRI